MPVIAWDRAEQNQWGELEVPFDPDEDWLEAFAEAVEEIADHRAQRSG